MDSFSMIPEMHLILQQYRRHTKKTISYCIIGRRVRVDMDEVSGEKNVAVKLPC